MWGVLASVGPCGRLPQSEVGLVFPYGSWSWVVTPLAELNHLGSQEELGSNPRQLSLAVIVISGVGTKALPCLLPLAFSPATLPLAL